MAEVRLELLSLDAQDALARALLVFCLVACAVVALALGVVFLAVLVTVLLAVMTRKAANSMTAENR